MPWGVGTTREVQLIARDDIWRAALPALAGAGLTAALDVTVEVGAAPGPEGAARVLLTRTEPRSIWQTALSIQANLRGLGYAASVGIERNDAAGGDVPLRLVLAVPGEPDAAALERLLRRALSPVLRRPASPPPLPTPPRHMLAPASFEVVTTPPPEPRPEPPSEGAAATPPVEPEPGVDAAPAVGAAPPGPVRPASEDAAADTPSDPDAAFGLAFPEIGRRPPPEPTDRPPVRRVPPPAAEAVVGAILSVIASAQPNPPGTRPAVAGPASDPPRDPTPSTDPGPVPVTDERPEREPSHPDRYQPAHASVPLTSAPPAPPAARTPPPPRPTPSAPWGPRVPGSGGSEPFPRPLPRTGAGAKPSTRVAGALPPPPGGSGAPAGAAPSRRAGGAGSHASASPTAAHSTILQPPAQGMARTTAGPAHPVPAPAPVTRQGPPRRVRATGAAQRRG